MGRRAMAWVEAYAKWNVPETKSKGEGIQLRMIPTTPPKKMDLPLPSLFFK
jgi:hypothetical protein